VGTSRRPARGRTQRSTEQWRGIIQRFERSGLSANAFCRQEGLARSTFDLRRLQISRDAQPAGFVELKPSPQDIGATGESWTLEVDFPGGVRLCFRGGR
jgi:hypothetical protein